jgi:sulfonate transport system permease protein
MSNTETVDPLYRRGGTAYRAARSFGVLAGALAAFVGAWYLWLALARFPEIIVPTPTEVASNIGNGFGGYLRDTGHTLGFGVLGSMIGLSVGSSLAYVSVLLPWSRALVSTGSVTVRSIPILALTPAIAAVFGYGQRGELAVTGAISFFPAFVLVSAAGQAVSQSRHEMLAVFGAGGPRRLLLLIAPSTVPALLTAARIAAANTVVSAVTAEFLVSNHGLGRSLAFSQVLLDSPHTWGIALVTVGISLTLYSLVHRLTERTIRRFS